MWNLQINAISARKEVPIYANTPTNLVAENKTGVYHNRNDQTRVEDHFLWGSNVETTQASNRMNEESQTQFLNALTLSCSSKLFSKTQNFTELPSPF